MQAPYFAAAGVDITRFFGGTINLDVAPYRIVILDAVATLRGVRWHPTEPAEDFSFVTCRIGPSPVGLEPALVYHPHPETKPEHHQPPTVVEVLAPRLPGIAAGAALFLTVPQGRARFVRL